MVDSTTEAKVFASHFTCQYAGAQRQTEHDVSTPMAEHFMVPRSAATPRQAAGHRSMSSLTPRRNLAAFPVMAGVPLTWDYCRAVGQRQNAARNGLGINPHLFQEGVIVVCSGEAEFHTGTMCSPSWPARPPITSSVSLAWRRNKDTFAVSCMAPPLAATTRRELAMKFRRLGPEVGALDIALKQQWIPTGQINGIVFIKVNRFCAASMAQYSRRSTPRERKADWAARKRVRTTNADRGATHCNPRVRGGSPEACRYDLVRSGREVTRSAPDSPSPGSRKPANGTHQRPHAELSARGLHLFFRMRLIFVNLRFPASDTQHKSCCHPDLEVGPVVIRMVLGP